MSAITIDHARRHMMRKHAAVLAGLLVLVIATLATLAAWSESAEYAASRVYPVTAAGVGVDYIGHRIPQSRVS